MRFIELIEDVVDAKDRFARRRQRRLMDQPEVGDVISHSAYAPGRTVALHEPRKVMAVAKQQPYAGYELWQITTDRGEDWFISYSTAAGWYHDYPDYTLPPEILEPRNVRRLGAR